MNKLTIAIPIYNQADYLEVALNKIVNQTCQEFQVIISDNCSTDHIEEVVDKFKEYDNITYIKEAALIPKADNWNRAISYSETEYTMMHHADDFLSLECVEDLLNVIDSNPEIGLFHGRYRVVSFEGVYISPITAFPFSYKYDFQNSLLKYFCTPAIVGLTFKTKLFREVEGFDTSFIHLMDWEFHYRVLKIAPFMFINKNLGAWRDNESGLSDELQHIQYVETLRLLDRYNLTTDKWAIRRFLVFFAKGKYFYKDRQEYKQEFENEISLSKFAWLYEIETNKLSFFLSDTLLKFYYNFYKIRHVFYSKTP